MMTNQSYYRIQPRPRTTNANRTDQSEIYLLGIDQRKSSEYQQIRQSRLLSPPILYQPTPTPDLYSMADETSSIFSYVPQTHSKPIRMSSTLLTIPKKHEKDKILSRNFPKGSFERRQIAQERRQKKQQNCRTPDYDSEHWFQLRQSLAELKRLAATEEVLVDPTTSLFNCDGYSFEALKQAIHHQQTQEKYRSGPSSTLSSFTPSNNRSRISFASSNRSGSRSALSRRQTESYPRPLDTPLIVAAKPLHPLLLTGNTSSAKVQRKTPSRSASSAAQRTQSATKVDEEKIDRRTLLSDLSNADDSPVSLTPTPPLEKQPETRPTSSSSILPPSRKISRISSSISLRSTIKLKGQVPRCQSALESQSSTLVNKSDPKFLIITDQEHRIESWYHHYPFISSDDLLQSFQSKYDKSLLLAYFIDEHPPVFNVHSKTKQYLQGKPFHLQNDLKKFDVVLISDRIYQDVIVHLQAVLTAIRSGGKIIHLHQINHEQDLKSQVRSICRQFNQHILTHV